MNLFRTLAKIAVVLCLIVVVLGAWVRLTDAGLGCPDWPGCYGELIVPEDPGSADAWPDRPLETGKAWREMIHRYAAGTLGFVVLALAAISWMRRNDPDQPVILPSALLGLVVFQALLGMWTVTLLLKPLVVTAHLLGGMTTLALLFWLARKPVAPTQAPEPGLRRFALVGLVVLGIQIFLGAWVSTNYAALACPDFPTCQNSFWPTMDFVAGFDPWHGLGIDYEGGILHNSARVAIHVTHRLGALATVAILLWLAIRAARNPALGTAAGLVMGGVILQFMLGIIMVVTQLPLPLAVAHNGIAALLLLSVVNLNKVVRVEN
ncbi:MAG: cytochrome B [Gammaproteobacteria bacterium SG8_31]|jgi:cytochrome c oxidase assembly protein subunit 15|nr:MAG: cytochrome B [Gammaproteobacteria bacterium SG8_31]